jgi:acyl dehydratase
MADGQPPLANITPGALVTREAKALVGSELSRAHGVVLKREFQRFAVAVGETNPLYFDPEYARAHGFRDVIAPPLFAANAVKQTAPLGTLRPDGTPSDDAFGSVPLPGCPRRMAGGESWCFVAPLYDGDALTAARRLDRIEQKSGRGGPFVVVDISCAYYRDGCELAARATISLIARP